MSKDQFTTYKNTLKVLSARTGTPLPSLILSFGVLHEITAVIPLVGVFYGARTLGVGESIIDSITCGRDKSSSTAFGAHGWLIEKSRHWVDEGDKWASRVGRRYGIFGCEMLPPSAPDTEVSPTPRHLSGDVANAIVAYGVTKILIPLRFGFSLYYAPAFSRRLLEPLRKSILAIFRHKVPPS
ncbi:hypothetical protein BDZ94DRAFT_1254988 [Collybia nuda]|uniref:Uncharacterized protein n=1 Tax=Collybia nuda TaxID=64659 RepID=A0A9P5Y7X0_9AGAR|nr:hypothetical protein BDZ94DRAFT_1254988 [Collybia nuda]